MHYISSKLINFITLSPTDGDSTTATTVTSSTLVVLVELMRLLLLLLLLLIFLSLLSPTIGVPFLVTNDHNRPVGR